MHFCTKTIGATCLAIGCLLDPSALVLAADGAATLLKHGDPVELPSIGRIVLGFIVTVAVAWAALYAMRRWLPRLASRHTTAGTLSVIVQSTTQNGLRLHMVNTGGHSILVAEGKTGIAMTVLPQRSEAATPATGQQAGQ